MNAPIKKKNLASFACLCFKLSDTNTQYMILHVNCTLSQDNSVNILTLRNVDLLASCLNNIWELRLTTVSVG